MILNSSMPNPILTIKASGLRNTINIGSDIDVSSMTEDELDSIRVVATAFAAMGVDIILASGKSPLQQVQEEIAIRSIDKLLSDEKG